MRVFLFEDDQAVRHAIEDWLERRGHESISFSQADTFCHSLEACPCVEGETCGDLILCDLRLPGKTGLELMRELLGKGCRAQHKALMSGWWSPDSLAEAAELEVAVFKKPVELGKILKWIESCADKVAKTPCPRVDHFRKHALGT